MSDFVTDGVRRHVEQRIEQLTRENTSVMENPMRYQLNAARIEELRLIATEIHKRLRAENAGG